MKFNLFAPVNPTGYGVHATNLMGHLDDFTLFPIGQVHNQGKYADKINKAISKGENYSSDCIGVCLWHANDMARFSGSHRVAYSVFELDRLSLREINHLQSVDYIIVPTEWARKIVLKWLYHAVLPRDEHEPDQIPVYVVPEGVDPEIFTYSREKDLDLSAKTVLLNVGKFEQRKGHIHLLNMLSSNKVKCDLIALWDNFFIPKERIYETIKAHGFSGPKNSYLDSDELEPSIPCRVFTHPSGNNIFMVNSNHDDPGFVRKLVDYADAGIFPYLAEGWNLPLIECMASGLPCIATDYSGPTEYLTPDNHIGLTNQGLMPAEDGVFFKGQGKWASISVEEMIEKVNSLNEEVIERINGELEGFGDLWNWKSAATKFMSVLKEISKE